MIRRFSTVIGSLKALAGNARALVGDTLRSTRGASVVIFVMAMVVIVGSTAYVIDLGNVYNAHRVLQASTDAAALAGASEVNCCTTQPGKALATASNFSAVSGARNASARMTATMAPGYPQFRCLTTTAVDCTGSDSANAIVVKQNASVPMNFARILGISSMNISATATAAAKAGPPIPIDVMIVLDTTGSMNTVDANCSVVAASRITCAKAGVLTLMTALKPSVASVGLMVFPGMATASEAAKNYDCSTSTPAIVKYSNSPAPVYSVLGLSNTYASTGSGGAITIDNTSNLVKAVGGGATGCKQGLSAVGGFGTYFADAITAAQAALVSTGRPGVRKVMIILSDGDSGSPSAYVGAAKYNNQCHQAINAAQAAAAAGTWVYSIAYGAPTSATGSCPTDLPRISGCSTMQQIAIDSGQPAYTVAPDRFYSDHGGPTGTCPSAHNATTDLVNLFKNIATTFAGTRLLFDTAS